MEGNFQVARSSKFGCCSLVALKCNTLQNNILYMSDPRIEKNTSELVQMLIFWSSRVHFGEVVTISVFKFDKGNICGSHIG